MNDFNIQDLGAVIGARQRDVTNQQLAYQNNLLQQGLQNASANQKNLNQLFNFKLIIKELGELVETYPQNQREIFKKILDAQKINTYSNSFSTIDFTDLAAKELSYDLFKYLHNITIWAETAISLDIQSEEKNRRRQEELDNLENASLKLKRKRGVLSFILEFLVKFSVSAAVLLGSLYLLFSWLQSHSH